MPSLFVYGTLRTPAGGPERDTKYNHRIVDHVGVGQRAQLHGAALHDLGAYPGIGPADGVVTGELFDITDEGLAICDVIEGHPGFYTRRPTTVMLENGTSVEAWVYWAPPSFIADRAKVESGDWFNRDVDALLPPVALPDDPHLHAVMDRVADEKFSWLTSTRPDQRPHNVPMWHVVDGNRIWFATPSNSVKVRNLAANPSVMISLPDPMNVVMIDAWATVHPEAMATIAPHFVERYNWDPSAEPDGSHTLIEASPIRVVAWHSETTRSEWVL